MEVTGQIYERISPKNLLGSLRVSGHCVQKLGHSPEMFWKVYADWIDKDEPEYLTPSVCRSSCLTKQK
jgi:hypothetical protein